MLSETSRHKFCEVWKDDDGDCIYLDARRAFTYQVFSDNRLHTVIAGETIFSIAGQYFAPRDRAAGLWWVIADFQPQPIHDPTIRLTTGSILVVPSLRTVVEIILNDRRRTESRV